MKEKGQKTVKKFLEKLKNRVQCIKIQVFLSYVLVLSLAFVLLGFSVALTARQMMTKQIGASRLDLLRQISERTNTIKTSATTLVGLYRYELTELPGFPEDVELDMDAFLTGEKDKYSSVFSPIGMDHDPLIAGARGVYSSLPPQERPPYLESQLWYRRLRRKLLDAPEGTVLFSSTFPTADGTRYQFAVGQAAGQGEEDCILMVLMDEGVLQRLYEPALADGSEIYIYDQQGYIVSHPNKKLLGKQFVDPQAMAELYGTNCATMIRKQRKAFLLTTYLDENTGWTIVEEIPAEMIFGELNRMYTIIAGVLAGCLVLSLGAALAQAQKIAKPLMGLSRAMDAFGGRNFTPVSVHTGTREIDLLSQSFNHMAGEITSLMQAVTEQERQKRLAEMNFLRAQINPHFLYNMLFSIRCTVEMGKSDQAVQMIQAFTDLLRTTLRTTEEAIPLEAEFENTRKYLVVQKLRYGDKVHFEMDLAPETGSCQVPPLILQPLVENAIFHGLEAREDSGLVVVSSALEGEDLLLTVADDGAGMTPEVLRRVTADMQALQDGREKQSDSIGLANVNNRLRLNYGPGYGATIESTPDMGTTITLRLPARRPQEKREEEQTCE